MQQAYASCGRLQHGRSSDPAAFSAELTTLNEIDERLPRAMLRVGFASLFQALHDYREPKEALAARVKPHRQRVIGCDRAGN